MSSWRHIHRPARVALGNAAHFACRAAAARTHSVSMAPKYARKLIAIIMYRTLPATRLAFSAARTAHEFRKWLYFQRT